MEFEPYWLALIAVPLIIRAVQTSVLGKHAKLKHGKIIFGAPGLGGLCGVVTLLGVAIAAGGWNQDARLTTTVLGVVIALSGLLYWPPTLVLDDAGVSAIYIWRPAKKLTYDEIEYATQSLGEVHVVGKHREITHTKYHVDAGTFEGALRKRGVQP
jgi:hypothetical protein